MAAKIIDKDRGYKALEKIVKNFRGYTVAVGVMKGSEERLEEESEEGSEERPLEEGEKEPLTNVKLAGVHEYGREDGSIPARSWNRAWVDENRAAVLRWKLRLAKRVVRGEITERRALGQLGELITSGMKSRIQKHIAPPLAEATKEARARRFKHGKSGDTPLMDLGLMVNAIVHEVRGAK
jgi:hypothetical protein